DYGGSGIDVDIFYKRYEVDSGWTTTQVVSTESTGGSYAPSLAVDHKGNLHVAWSDETDYGGSGTDWDTFYKRNEVGSGWTTTEVIVDFTGDAYHVSLAVDSSGNVDIAWEDSTAIYGADWDIFYKRYETAKYAALTDVMTGVDGCSPDGRRTQHGLRSLYQHPPSRTGFVRFVYDRQRYALLVHPMVLLRHSEQSHCRLELFMV
ncbi:MAG: hypothetical protein ACXADS_16455, partial [Candidatus Thorarchaeota archaeon]